MEKYLEATGKTIDAAIEAALIELGMERDSVSVEVLEKAKSGFFGLGAAPARIRVSYSVSHADKAENFLIGLLGKMGSSAKPVIREQTDGNLSVDFIGSGLGFLIGHRGDTLDAIQHLTNFVVNRGEESPFRVDVDAENYRAKRTDALKRMARKTGEKVLQSRRNMTLEPMNAYERHIIHTSLQEMPGLSTCSVGTEPNRRVVISCIRAPGERPPVDRDRGGKPRMPGGPPGARPDNRYGGNKPYAKQPMGGRPPRGPGLPKPPARPGVGAPGGTHGGTPARPGVGTPGGTPVRPGAGTPTRPGAGAPGFGDRDTRRPPPLPQSPQHTQQTPHTPHPQNADSPRIYPPSGRPPRPYERAPRTTPSHAQPQKTAPAAAPKPLPKPAPKPPNKPSAGGPPGPRPYDRLPRE
ncbi:MAG: Jag N-terminal domain-containing protein [Oscillospiraceae bacterium]|nr:Jag N-terminal domain-containing protein [Oscillospiraceae bacterium]